MARYNRKYYNRRRNYRRKALSTSRIFGRTSAKSQAKQIYALKKSVNTLNKRFKPEIYTHHNDAISKTFTNSTFAASYWTGYYSWPSNGTTDETKRGDKIYCKNMQLNFTFEYHNNSSTAYHAGESSGCPMRIIILKTKQPVNPSALPDLSDILLYSNYSGTEYIQRAVSPYVHGITDKYRLLYNRVFYMNPTKNQKAMRIFLRPGLIQWESSNTATHVFIFVAPCGLHSDADFTETIEMTMSSKIAYIDY